MLPLQRVHFETYRKMGMSVAVKPRSFSKILLITQLMTNLVISPWAQAQCNPFIFSSLRRSLIPKEILPESIEKLYLNHKPSGWAEVIQTAKKDPKLLLDLGGNKEGAQSLVLAEGTSVVFKEFSSIPFLNFKKIILQLQKWERQGVGPRLIGISIQDTPDPNEGRFTLVMENLFADENAYGKNLLSGDGVELRLLRKEPKEARLWLKNQMLSLLATHPDPHPKNIVFRVTQLKQKALKPPKGSFFQWGDKIYQGFLVDPSGSEGNPQHTLFHTEIEKTPQPLLQYNHKWKNLFFTKELDL
jgi:hypothetical protein